MVRVGHPARLLPSVLAHCLDAKIEGNDGSKIVTDVRDEIAEMLKAASSSRNKGDRRKIRGNDEKFSFRSYLFIGFSSNLILFLIDLFNKNTHWDY